MNNRIIKFLTKLCQADIDIFNAYQLALEKIHIAAMQQSLKQFQEQHYQHIEELNEEIKKLGGEIVKNSLDLKGLLTEGYTLLRSATGTEGALKAMHFNERLILAAYQTVANQDLPAELKSMLNIFLNEEKKHLEYIELLLNTKPWSPTGVPYDSDNKG